MEGNEKLNTPTPGRKNNPDDILKKEKGHQVVEEKKRTDNSCDQAPGERIINKV